MTCPTFHPRRRSSAGWRMSWREPLPSGEEGFEPPPAIAPHRDRKGRMFLPHPSTTAERQPIQSCHSHLAPRFRRDETLLPTESGRERPERRPHNPVPRHAERLCTPVALPPSRRACDTPVREISRFPPGAAHLRAELHHRACATGGFFEQNGCRCSQNPAEVWEGQLPKPEAQPRASWGVRLTPHQTWRQVGHSSARSLFANAALSNSCFKIHARERRCVKGQLLV